MEKWWEDLGLPEPDKLASSQSNYRVVLLGFPQSGKRTLCQRLSLIASSTKKSNATNDPRSPLRRHVQLPSGKLFALSDLEATDGAQEETSTEETMADALKPGVESAASILLSGTGVAYTYVIQNLPWHTSYTTRSRVSVKSRVLEFFCCDCPGALAAAIPSPEWFRSSVVIMVVDVSLPDSIKEQLDWCLQTLEQHIRSVLRETAPGRDDLYYQEMTDATHKFWENEKKNLHEVRQHLESQVLGDSTLLPNSEEPLHISDSSVVPSLRTIIVCTKLDLLEKLSKEYNVAPKESLGKFFHPAFQQALENSRLSVLSLVMQLMRNYAMIYQSALVSIKGRIRDYSDADLLVHPFYKGFMGYIEHLLETYPSSGEEDIVPVKQADLTSLVEQLVSLCNADYVPYSLIPGGVDKISLLNSFVTAQTITLPAATMSVKGTGVFAPPSFPFHQNILSMMAKEAHNSIPKIHEEEGGEGMIWDSI